MALLLAASIWCWVVIVERALALRRLRGAVETLRGGAEASPLGFIVAAGRSAAARAIPGESVGERRQRVVEALNREARGVLAEAEQGLPVLAIIASAAPFVGLFGTVWGIMTSFAGIAQAQDTSLAVVAPGIAEALSATAYGLAAAIPASVGYTRLGGGLASLGQRLGDTLEEVAVNLIDPREAR